MAVRPEGANHRLRKSRCGSRGQPFSLCADEFAAQTRTEIAKWAKVIRSADIKVQ
jgi:hypothetical protein